MLDPRSGNTGPTQPIRGGVAACLLAGVLMPVGCADPTGPPLPDAVEIAGAEEPLTALGETVELEAVVLDAHGNTLEHGVEWSSHDPTVATVDEEGTLTATGAGTTEVEARAGEVAGTAPVTVEPRPSAMDAALGNAQEGVVGKPLPDSVGVEVRDAGGSTVEAAPVEFRVISGEGAVSPSSVDTDENGRARVEWKLGTDASADHRLRAEVKLEGETVQTEFAARALAAPPSALSVTGGNGQEGYALEPLADSVAVRVEDEFGNPVPGAVVTWEPPEQGGVVAPNPAVTDSLGAARGEWTPGDGDGAMELRAHVEDVEPGTIQAEVEPNAVIAARLGGGEEELASVTLERESSRWPRVARSARDDDGSRDDGETDVAYPSRSLMALTREGGVFREGPALEGRGEGTGGRGASHPPHRREVLVTLREGARVAPGLRAEAAANPGRAPELASRLREWAEGLGPGGTEVLGSSPVLGTTRVRVPPQADPEGFKAQLRQRDDVERATWNRTLRAFEGDPAPEPASLPPSAPAAPHGFNPLQTWHFRALDLERAWEVERGSEDVVVAVVDDGFRFDHPWLEDRWASQGYSFVEEEELDRCDGGTVSSTGHGEGPGPDATVPVRYWWNPTRRCVADRMDRGGHGMQVAGVIAGESDGEIRGTGVAPGVRILPVRALNVVGQGSAYAVAQGILYAAGLPADDGRGGTVTAGEPADVINLSLGGPSPDSLVHEAVQEAVDAGALVVGAAGNDGSSAVAYPARHPEVVAVSAVDPRWELTWYSNRGSSIELTAPGGVADPGADHSVWTAQWDFESSRPAMGAAQGTSMSAPHVAGVAALVLSASPGLSAAEARRRLRDHAFPLGPGSPNTLYGHGLVDAFWTLTEGRGRPAEAHAVLYDADTGEALETAPMGSGGEARFSRLDPGSYWVFGGMRAPDGASFGRPPDAWGAFGEVGLPEPVVVEGSGLDETAVTLGPPVAGQDGGSLDTEEVLPPGGYLAARLADPGSAHLYRLPVPEPGPYVVETTGVQGACGLAGELDTHVEVRGPDDQVLGSSAAVDEEAGNHCSRLHLDLEPGHHTIRVTSHDGRPGLYRILARADGES